MFTRFIAAAIVMTISLPALGSDITNLNNWYLVEDDPNNSMTTTIDPSGSSVTLNITGPIGPNDDIGLTTINDFDAANSTAGFKFSRDQDFKAAIDFSISGLDSIVGSLGLGFGFGEDIDGTDSFGAGILFTSAPAESLLAFTVVIANDTQAGVLPFFGSTPMTGSFIVEYDAATGNAFAGYAAAGATDFVIGQTTLAPAPVDSIWDDEELILSLFITGGGRATNLATGVLDGSAAITFSNARVISGSPTIIPEPASATLLIMGLCAVATRRRLNASM